MSRKPFFLFFLLCVVAIFAAGREGYYRFPSLHGDTIVFTSEGDLWSVPAGSGIAQRLTTHPGQETSPAISPDGKQIAFLAQYEGPTEIYTMPITGGLPVRRTFTGQVATVSSWAAPETILFSTQKYSTLPNTQLVKLDITSGRETILPLAQASEGVIDPTGKTLYFTRLPFQGSYTKRYRGGTAQNLWKFIDGSTEAVPLTMDYPGTSKSPLLWQDRLYFLSDRDGIMNLWSMGLDGKNLKQHTFHKEFDASSPSLQNGRIVYQLVSDLYLYDIASGKTCPIKIQLASDYDQMRENWVKEPMTYLTSAHISPEGDRLLLTSRGQVFSFPVQQGRQVRLTRREGIRRRSARFFPDGKQVLFLADESGEWEFYRCPVDGTGSTEILSTGAQVLRFDGLPSPDGQWIAFADKDNRLWLLDLRIGKTKQIASSPNGMPSDLSWSPDSRWLAFVQAADNQFNQIMLHQVAEGRSLAMTGDRVDSFNPVWSPDGKWIYFLSDRFFESVVGSPWGPRQPEPYFAKTTKLYAAALTDGLIFPFAADTEFAPPTTEKGAISPSQKKGKEKKAVIIDEAGLSGRILEVPIPAGSYGDLAMTEKVIFLSDTDPGSRGSGRLLALEITNKKPQAKTLVEGIQSFELAANGKKILITKERAFYVIDAGTQPPGQLNEKRVDLSRWMLSIDPRHEWKQMLVDAWRMERDYFYDRNLHGVDYHGLLNRYLPFLDRISDRSELNDLMAHLVGELSALHTFVRGGDIRRGSDDIQAGSLGALLQRDDSQGGYRIAHIYRSAPEYPEKLSPLAQPLLPVAEGDTILTINGTSVLDVPDPHLLLRNTAGQQVLLEVKGKVDGRVRRLIVFPIPIAQEGDLRYEEWEYTRRIETERLGGGEIGYVHLRAMGSGNYSEWVKNFYPVFNRKGLIIDVRHNRGGNIDSWILGKLMRKAWFFWQPRVGAPSWNMQYAFRGHMVVLCNERTASDGEAFAEGFRRLGLGKVIGTRTWGGEIWLSSSNTLVDRGLASAAETGVYGPDGIWLIEGHGVDPDIVIDNLPHAAFQGKDTQLEAAVRFLQEKIKAEPIEVPPAPPYPDKRFPRKGN